MAIKLFNMAPDGVENRTILKDLVAQMISSLASIYGAQNQTSNYMNYSIYEHYGQTPRADEMATRFEHICPIARRLQETGPIDGLFTECPVDAAMPDHVFNYIVDHIIPLDIEPSQVQSFMLSNRYVKAIDHVAHSRSGVTKYSRFAATIGKASTFKDILALNATFTKLSSHIPNPAVQSVFDSWAQNKIMDLCAAIRSFGRGDAQPLLQLLEVDPKIWDK